MNFEQVAEILAEIKYRDWKLYASDMPIMWLQIRFVDEKGFEQRCRKWYISYHATKSEIVQTAFLACLQAEEHEARERFYYNNSRVFSPHIDVDFLANGGVRRFDYRN